MNSSRELSEISAELDRLVAAYEKSNDPEVRKFVIKLKRVRRKASILDHAGTGVKLLWLADRIRELLDDLSP